MSVKRYFQKALCGAQPGHPFYGNQYSSGSGGSGKLPGARTERTKGGGERVVTNSGRVLLESDRGVSKERDRAYSELEKARASGDEAKIKAAQQKMMEVADRETQAAKGPSNTRSGGILYSKEGQTQSYKDLKKVTHTIKWSPYSQPEDVTIEKVRNGIVTVRRLDGSLVKANSVVSQDILEGKHRK